MHSPSLVFYYCAEFTGLKAFTAFHTCRLVNLMWFLLLPFYCFRGTCLCAEHTSLAGICFYGIGKKGGTAVGRTFFVVNMGLILFRKVFEGGKHGIWCSLAQTANRIISDLECKVFQ